ncbi:MAG: glycosyltransferase [Bacilli bacterium]|nr:glycosyltransferase [Bacilli bacterium]
MKKNNKEIKDKNKLSIIVPNYNNEHFLKKSVECLINQSYKNVEIIVVNDGSKGDCDSLMENYAYDKRVKYVKHEVNKGLFQARLTGADAATGDYIAFLDADDYISVDYYRTLMDEIVHSGSDMVFGNTVLEYDDGRREEYPLFRMKFNELNGDDCLNEYFRQKGFVFSWHTVWNKVYSMKIWKKARKHYDKITKRLIMTEDFAFSTVLFYYTKKITKVMNDAIFYCQHENTSTSVKDIDTNKARNNINDLLTSFNFVEDFLKEVKIYDKYKEDFQDWKHLYSLQHRSQISCANKISSSDKEELYEFLNQYCDNTEEIDDSNFFASITHTWNEELEDIKNQIMNPEIKCVSFDIFDTLVVRPFYEPIDLFKVLEKEYIKLSNSKCGLNFSKVRVTAENIARDEQFRIDPSIQEVTLEDIYKMINKLYDIDKKILNKVMEKEQELEVRFCTRRQTAYELFTLAKAMGKKVICTSDMYLPEKTIVAILEKNGYDCDKLYLSSVVKKTKWTGDLFRHVIKDMNITADEMIHIGDNYETDYSRANSLGINAIHFVKTTEVMTNKYYSGNLSKMLTESLPFWQDNRESMRFMGIRSMLAVVANKYFDNPYRTFDKTSDFNSDPFLIGYYAMGMYAYGVTDWLIKLMKNRNDKISFMARDGYLIMETYRIMKELHTDLPEIEYMYVSRRALIPTMITSKLDFYKLSEIVNFDNHSPKSIIKYIESIVNIDVDKLKELCDKEKIKFESKFKTIEEFNKYIKVIVDNFYDEDVHNKKRESLRKYFDKILGEKPGVFDVGYSGRPEFYLSDLCNKKIDTYFLNINKDEALEYSSRGEFNIFTFFPAKPTATGNAYELLFSKLAPSCIGYDISDKEVKPIFEEYKSDYKVDYIVETMQEASIEFIKDIINIFGEDTDILYYQDYYISLPIMAYFNAARFVDKLPLAAVKFEDEIRTGETRVMINDMQEDLDSKNQYNLEELFFKSKDTKNSTGVLRYNATVDLTNRSKFSRLLFYALFDRKTLKRRFKEITYKFRRK